LRNLGSGVRNEKFPVIPRHESRRCRSKGPSSQTKTKLVHHPLRMTEIDRILISYKYIDTGFSFAISLRLVPARTNNDVLLVLGLTSEEVLKNFPSAVGIAFLSVE
jgi:hypothetical protein